MLTGNERTIDLSADLGEASTDDQRAIEEQIWSLVHSVNVACGGHAGDDASMEHAALRARAHNLRLGAHPSYPDRENFGRVSMSMTPAALRGSLTAQLTRLRDVAAHEDVLLTHVKPHGALYNDAHHDRLLASIVVEAIQSVDPSLALVASSSSQMAMAARTAGLRVIREAFADRRYLPDGSLVARSQSGALLTVDEAAAQAELLVQEHSVIAQNGRRIAVAFETICIHSDMDDSVARLRAIRTRLLLV